MYILFFVGILIAFFASAQAAIGECSITPLWLPWGNVTVSADGLAVSRGVELGIGTPVQVFSFRPATTLNNTRVYNVIDCVSAANTTCVGGTGGVFDTSKSTTYTVAIKPQWNGSTADTETDTGSYVYFNDDLNFEQNGAVDGFPLVMATELGQGTQNGLPLGSDSSFLSAAKKSGVSPSKAWGLWAGSRSLSPVDGALVVGGYDNSRLAGNFTTFPIGTWSGDQPCPLQASIAQITYNQPDGSQVALFSNTKEPMNACVEPVQQRFTFTPDVVNNFIDINATDYNSSYPGLTYPTTAVPAGNLTIILSNGYSTTVPNSELFTLLRGSDKNGRYAIKNSSVVETGISYNAAANPATVQPILGGLFLTFNYLVVDYEAGIFQLAPAVGGDMDDSARQLKSICTQAPSNATTTPPPTLAPKKSNTGPIVGGVVGGIGGLAIILSGIFFFVRHRRKSNAGKSNGVPQEMEAHDRKESVMTNDQRLRSVVSSELPSPFPQQLQAESRPYEMPSPPHRYQEVERF